ncbi:MAG: hypothetical protein ACTSRZ_18990 [Promethearchaeota archaeon]
MKKNNYIIILFAILFVSLSYFPSRIFNANSNFQNSIEENLNAQNGNEVYKIYDQAFIGVSSDKKYDNETLDVLNTSKPIYIYLDDNLSLQNPYMLMLSDLEQFFGYRYGTKLIRVDDDLAVAMSGILNNSIVIGNETINNATNWLVNFGGLDVSNFTPEPNGFDMRTFSIGSNSCVVIRGADKFGDASGIYWLIDRCRTQPVGEVNLTAFRTPDLAFRMTSVHIEIPKSTDLQNMTEYIMNSTFETINGAIRRGANKILITGDYRFIGQYPFLCNYSWNTEIQSRLESSWNLTEIEYRRKYVNDVLDYIDSMGADSFFWGDQLHVLSPAIKNWLLETGEIDIRNPRVKDLLQGQLREIFETYKKVDGVMLRVGDDLYCYGDDPNFDYGAKIMYSPRTFRETTQSMMEIIKEYNKTMVLRTWQMSVRDDCVHASAKAYDEAFGDLYYSEDELILSIKYTPNDYQRIPINPTFNRGAIKQIVEFQTINSFENYQYTPLCTATTYLNALQNLTTTTNGTGSNLLIGYFNQWDHEIDLNTSALEGPGAETNYRREGQFYFMQRSSWDINLSLIEFSKDLAAKQLGREKEIRDNFWRWYNLSDRVHWHLLYLPGHREKAPWLKSRWLHYGRFIKADPQAFGYIYYFCKDDIDAVIESVAKGRELAYEMKAIIENVTLYVSTQNQIYLQYHLNKAQIMVDFAELAYWYIRTAMHWWKYMETFDLNMRKEAFKDLPNLKSALQHFDLTYHYYWENPSGHKIGLHEVYAFVHWIEISNLNMAIGLIAGFSIIGLIAISLIAKNVSSKNIFIRTLRTTFIHPSQLFSLLNIIKDEKKREFKSNLEDVERNISKINLFLSSAAKEALIPLVSVPMLSGLLLNCASFWQYPMICLAVASSIVGGAQALIFLIGFIKIRSINSIDINRLEKNKGNQNNTNGNIKPDVASNGLINALIDAITMTGYVSSVGLPIIAVFFIYIALVTPLGIFAGPITLKLLVEPRFLSFTPISFEAVIFLVLGFLTPIWAISIIIANLFKNKSRISKTLLGIGIFILMHYFAVGILLAQFPQLLSDIDYYLNHFLGTYSPIEFFS